MINPLFKLYANNLNYGFSSVSLSKTESITQILVFLTKVE